MKFIDKIKNRLAKYFLKRYSHSRKRQSSFFNFNDAKTFGILMEAKTIEDVELMKKYVAYLRDMRKKVKVLGFFSVKDTPQITYSRLEFEFFGIKDINWFKKPRPSCYAGFANQEFDILIDLNVNETIPLKYVSSASKARCKIGRYDAADDKAYDLMIALDPPASVKNFLKEVDSYLSKINDQPKTFS
jgi:hypothetical protein